MQSLPQKITFVNRTQENFFAALKTRVDEYFASSNRSKYANFTMVSKSVFYFFGAIGLYLCVLLGSMDESVRLILTLFLGFFMAAIGFNIGHDAIHGAYTPYRWLNYLISQTFEVAGGNIYVWRIYHNIVHHTYTNIPGADQDIDGVPIIHLYPRKESVRKHYLRYQHIYSFLFYSLTSLNWVLAKDYTRMFKSSAGVYKHKRPPLREYFILFFYKSFHYAVFIVLPIMILDVAVWKVILGFILMHMVTGLTLAMVFQLAHVVEHPEFPSPNEKGEIENEWAIHQLKTTANFSTKSFLATWICGGLNAQIEHHLFPQICHVHYRKISDIVKNTALEYNLPYYENKNFWTALRSHIRHLKEVGRQGIAA